MYAGVYAQIITDIVVSGAIGPDMNCIRLLHPDENMVFTVMLGKTLNFSILPKVIIRNKVFFIKDNNN